MPNALTEVSADLTAVTRELERIATSHAFRKAERCLRLLRHLTATALQGRAGELKEYTLGVTVFDRPPSFDPRTDPVVRLEVRRLRLKLAEYYQQEGFDDAVLIELPKGAYVPHFRPRQAPALEIAAPPRARWRFLPPRLVARWAAAAAVLSLAGYAWNALHQRGERPVVRASVAVLGFRDLAPRAASAWISPALTELIDIELGAGRQLRTAPPENVTRMHTELSLAPQSTYPAQALQRIRANLGIDYAAAGAYLSRGHRVRLDVSLFDARSGRQIAAFAEEAAEDRIPELAQTAARRIRAHLGLRLSSLEDASQYPPVEPAAMESYALGMERLRQADALAARPYLEKAASAAPSNPLVHSGLAAALSMLGYDNRARAEAKLALDSAAPLGRVEQLEIEGRYREMAHDWPRAIAVYQALFTLLPDDLEYGLLLAAAETNGNKAQDALATVKALRGLPVPQGDDPRIDLAEAHAAGALSDLAHTRRAAHAAAEKASQHGARLLYARARLLESGAMQTMSVAGFAEARAEARRICSELGDRACVAAAYRNEGNLLAITNAPAAARPFFQAALKIANEMGNLVEKHNDLNGLGYVERLQGDLRAAEADDRAALEVGAQLGPRKEYPIRLALADVLAAEGRAAESRALSEQGLEVARRIGERQGIGNGEAALAHALALEGKFPEAVSRSNEAIRILREVYDRTEAAMALLERGDTEIRQGNLEAARKSYEEARDIARQFPGGLGAAPQIDMAFARLSSAGGQFEDAAAHARAALNAFTAAGREGDRMQAAALLARALIARGRIGEASGVIAQIPPYEGKALPIEAVVEFRIARCFVAANTGRRAEAMRAMDGIVLDVSRLGLPVLGNEVRLAREAVRKTQLTRS